MSYSLGERVTGVVSSVADYGAFVRLPNGSTGMIHISKLSHDYISDIRSVIKRDDVVTATVISVSDGKIALSLIADSPKPTRPSRQSFETSDFESMLSSISVCKIRSTSLLNKVSTR